MDINKIRVNLSMEEQTQAAINELIISIDKFLKEINAVKGKLDNHTAQINKAAADGAKGYTRRPSFADIINKAKKR